MVILGWSVCVRDERKHMVKRLACKSVRSSGVKPVERIIGDIELERLLRGEFPLKRFGADQV